MKQNKQTNRIGNFNVKMLLIAVLALLMAFTLVACNNDKKNNNDNSSDEVSETELYVGTGGIWDYMTKEDLEFMYGFMFTKVYAEPQTRASYQLLPVMSYPIKDEPDAYLYFNLTMSCSASDVTERETSLSGYIYKSHEIAVQMAEDTDEPGREIIVKDNMVLEVDQSFPYIEDIRTDNYNLDSLRGKQMKLVNIMMMKHSIYSLAILVANDFENMSGTLGQCGYYENNHSNCAVTETIGYLSGEGTEKIIEQVITEFDYFKPQIGIEYSEESVAEFDVSEGYVHTKIKIKPGIRFESTAESEASVLEYYYDSEEDMDAIVPDTTPDGKAVTGITHRNAHPIIYGILQLNYIKSITIPISVNTISPDTFSYCESLQAVYYCGNEEQWNEINIGSGNDALVNAKRYYCSEQPNYDGNHWHWNAQHKPEVWAN